MSTRFSEEQVALAPVKKGEDPAQGSSILPYIIGGGLLVVMVLGFIFSTRATSAEVSVPTALPTALPTVAPVPTISPIATYQSLIEAHLRKGEYREAQSVAQGALAIDGLTENEQRILNGYIISVGLKSIESSVFEPLDRTQHQELVDTYLSLRERARVSGVELDSPLQVAKKAHASSQFPLAKVAIEEAYTDSLFDPKIDRDVTRLYASVMFSLGRWYTTAEQGSPLYVEGLRALVTSDRVADHYQTGQSEAEELLRQLGYPTKASWPAPLDTPLIP